MAKFLLFFIVLAAQSLAAQPPAQAAGADPAFARLGHALGTLRQEALELERDLLLLEARQRQAAGHYTFYVTLAADIPLTLENLRLDADGMTLIDHEYAPGEEAALRQGGAQRLHDGELPPGGHTLRATVVGRLADAPFRGSAALKLADGATARVLRLRIEQSEEGGNALRLVLEPWQ